MREIDVGEIIKAVEELCIKANKILPDDLCGWYILCRKIRDR